MTIRTSTSRSYLMRLGLVGLFCLGGGLYFLYDGMIGWPQKRERGFDFLQYIEDNADLDEKDQLDQWKMRAAEKGWPTDNPLDPETNKPISKIKINDQFLYAGAAGLAALCFLSRVVFMLGRWVECDEAGLRNRGGQAAKFSEITALDKKKWQSKGIAFVQYQSNGRTGRLRLDDYFYDRATTRAILRQVESRIDAAKIVNGKPEPPETPVVSAETVDISAQATQV